ncbi:MAG TPA: Rid family detoxifying hydrolase [Candidatus Omnitrophota bacterium]|nr:Rid family detoxifying hydrolase [Candidatus Omnitrophota bacterium]HPS20328.1 Rid family detoxifying hydrolase [Candidatus Omnitrophota bacterium]
MINVTGKTEIKTDKAPVAGPYSQAVAAGAFVFVSGQMPIDPATGQVVEGGIVAETAQVFKNMEAVLAAAGLGLDSVVRTEVFLKNIEDFPAFNDIYSAKFTSGTKPARFLIEAAALPKGAKVEIACIAYRG